MLTGKYRIEKRLFGGFNIMVQDSCFNSSYPTDMIIIYYWRKANMEDLKILFKKSAKLVQNNI